MKQQKITPGEMEHFIEMEQELNELKKQQGIENRSSWWKRLGDAWFSYMDHYVPKLVSRKRYLLLACLTGWFGGHRFYLGQKWLGMVYLLLFWTGIPFTMSVIDIMIAVPKQPDETGNILL